MKKVLKANKAPQFNVHPSYSVEEILEAGGTTAFALKNGLSGKGQMKAIAKLPSISFTNNEWNEIMELLENDK